MFEEVMTEGFATELEKFGFDPFAAVAKDEGYIRTASVALASYRGGRNALKSSRLRELFQPRDAAVRTFLENMKP